jgi:hypothetical protein
VRAKKGVFCLTSNHPSDERLTGTRRTYHEDSSRTDSTCIGIAFGAPEEVDDFAHLTFCSFVSGYVRESRQRLLLVVDLGLEPPIPMTPESTFLPRRPIHTKNAMKRRNGKSVRRSVRTLDPCPTPVTDT